MKKRPALDTQKIVLALSPETIKDIIKASLGSQQANVDKWSESMIGFLTLCNGGAATAVLALIGATEAFRAAASLYYALVLFITGLGLIGALWLAQGFRQVKYNNHLMNAISAVDVGNFDAARPHIASIAGEEIISNAGFVCARISFYCFVGGSLSAALSALWLR
jgi:hypothetical protein